MNLETAGSVDLGSGVAAQFVWQENSTPGEGIPCGAILRHGFCSLYVAWVEDGWLYADGVRPHWSLVSLNPLSITPGVTCPTCGRVGVIHDGEWIDVTEDLEVWPS